MWTETKLIETVETETETHWDNWNSDKLIKTNYYCQNVSQKLCFSHMETSIRVSQSPTLHNKVPCCVGTQGAHQGKGAAHRPPAHCPGTQPQHVQIASSRKVLLATIGHLLATCQSLIGHLPVTCCLPPLMTGLCWKSCGKSAIFCWLPLLTVGFCLFVMTDCSR